MRTLNNEFLTYEQALELKELGFDEECCAMFMKDVLKLRCWCKNSEFEDKILFTAAPTFSQAFRWFREKYVLLGFIEPANGYEDKSLFAFYICDDEQNIINDEHSYSKDSSLHFKTYEEAELACIDKLIEIVKKWNIK